MSIIMLTIVKNFESLGIIFAVYMYVVAVCYFFIKHLKLKRRVELKESKRLEILKNHLGYFYNY